MKNIMSNVDPQELNRVEQHATGRPLIVTNEGGTMLAASSSGFIEYPIAAAALTPLDTLVGAASSSSGPEAVPPSPTPPGGA